MKYLLSITTILFLVLTSCVESDMTKDDEVGPMIELDDAVTAVMVGNTLQLTARYFENGEEKAVDFEWSSDSEHATVDENGLVTGVSKGAASITASYEGTVSPSHDIQVVGDPSEIASVEIIAPKTHLDVDEEVQLSVEAKNLNGEIVEVMSEIIWESSATDIVSVDAEGLATAHMDGSAEVTATVDDVSSKPFMLAVGDQVRSGPFMENGYTAEGTATLMYDDNGDLILTFSSDFKTSFALGTFIYLSNSTDGGATKANGLELEEIDSNGAKEFNVSAIDSDVTIDTYDYVIILCKPASITFGYAELMP